MTLEKKEALMKALRYWLSSFALVSGLLYYKSSVTLGAVLIAGLLTFAITVGRAFMKTS